MAATSSELVKQTQQANEEKEKIKKEYVEYLASQVGIELPVAQN